MVLEDEDDLLNDVEPVNNNNQVIPGDNDNDNFLELENIDGGAQPSLIEDVLKLRGINDSKITIIGEDDKEEEVNFYDLSREEQLEILNSSNRSLEDELDKDEINLFNHLRTNNLSVEDYLKQYKEQVIEEYSKTLTPPEKTYDIDDYDDQELYLMDLKNKFDLTEEELVKELEKELKDEDLFTKKTAKLREEYKKLEDQYKASQLQEAEEQREAEFNKFADTMVDIATKASEFHGIELEDEDKNETLSYLLELDEKGLSSFYKDLNNPTKLFEAAWYLRYGKEAFDALKSAYEAEIAKLRKPDKPRVVVQNAKNYNSIHDLH